MGTTRDRIGAIYGDVGSTHYDVAVSDETLKRLDYVETEHEGQRILGLVTSVTRQSRLSHDDALHGGSADERLAAHVDVIGYLDGRGRVQTPRTPFPAGAEVSLAEEGLVTSVLGLRSDGGGAYIGHVKGLSIPVRLDLNTLAQKHISVLAKTGAGKSYTVGVLLEEFLSADVPLVILDPHGEYSALRSPNVDDDELDAMVRYGVKPRSFQKQLKEYAIDTHLNPDAEPLRLEGINLEAREIVDLLPQKLAGGQVGVLYQAVKDVSDELPAWTLPDITDAVGRNKSNAKWNVLNALEAVQAMGIFHARGTPAKDLVQPGRCTIINLKGVPPDVQEVVAARVCSLLWNSRKRNEVPPHMLVVEEAHNFCPERGIGTAVSGGVLRTVASEGRKFGLGLVIVSQRPAKIDKNVLSQCNTQVVLKVTNPNDLRAITTSVEGITSASADEVQRLPVGVALVAGGGLTQPVFVDVRPRMTRHGGASVDIVKGRSKKTAAPAAAQRPAAAPAAAGAPPRPTDRDPSTPPAPMLPPSRPCNGAAAEASPESPASKPGSSASGNDNADRSRSKTSPTPRDPPPTRHLPTRRTHRQTSSPRTEGADRHAADALPGTDPRSNGAKPGTPRETRSSPEAAAWTPKARDLKGMVRVAHRIGVAVDEDAERVRRLLQQMAALEGRPSDHYERLYAEVGRGACRVKEPACIRCPLRRDCRYHEALQAERHKSRGVIRRLWRN